MADPERKHGREVIDDLVQVMGDQTELAQAEEHFFAGLQAGMATPALRTAMWRTSSPSQTPSAQPDGAMTAHLAGWARFGARDTF